MNLLKKTSIVIFYFSIAYCNYSFGQSENEIELNESSIYELNGNYMINSMDSSKLLPICLINSFYFNWENLADSNDYIKIEVLTPKKIRIELYDNGKLIKSKKVKGEIDKGLFS